MDSHVKREVHEAVASLAVPSLVMITLTLLLCYQAVKWITRPLYQLQRELESRREENLDPVACHSQVQEHQKLNLLFALMPQPDHADHLENQQDQTDGQDEAKAHTAMIETSYHVASRTPSCVTSA